MEDETIPAAPVTRESVYKESKDIIVGGTNVSLSKSDLDNTITIHASGGGGGGGSLSASDVAKLAGITSNTETSDRTTADTALGTRIDGVKTTADNALVRTNRLIPLTVWELTDEARTILFEWKPVDAVHTNINATFVVGGNTINNVNPSEGVAALDPIGTVLEISITKTQAQNITRSSDAIAGFVECQITVSGEILGTCWMTTAPTAAAADPARERVLIANARSTTSTGVATLQLPTDYTDFKYVEIVTGTTSETNSNAHDVKIIETAWLALQQDGDNVKIGILDQNEAGSGQWMTWTPTTRTFGFGTQGGTATNPRIKAARLFDGGPKGEKGDQGDPGTDGSDGTNGLSGAIRNQRDARETLVIWSGTEAQYNAITTKATNPPTIYLWT